MVICQDQCYQYFLKMLINATKQRFPYQGSLQIQSRDCNCIQKLNSRHTWGLNNNQMCFIPSDNLFWNHPFKRKVTGKFRSVLSVGVGRRRTKDLRLPCTTNSLTISFYCIKLKTYVALWDFACQHANLLNNTKWIGFIQDCVQSFTHKTYSMVAY